jgi:hypothetical protein
MRRESFGFAQDDSAENALSNQKPSGDVMPEGKLD